MGRRGLETTLTAGEVKRLLAALESGVPQLALLSTYRIGMINLRKIIKGTYVPRKEAHGDT